MFKKILLIVLVLCVGFVSIVHAVGETEFVELENPVGTDLWGVINRAINILFLICMYGGLILIIWAGFTMITAQGDAGKTKKAWQMIQSVIIGIVIVLLARALIGFTYYIVTGKSGGLPGLNKNTNVEKEENEPYIAPEGGQIQELNSNLFNQ